MAWNVSATPELAVLDGDGIEALRWFGGRWTGSQSGRAELARRAQPEPNSNEALRAAAQVVAEHIGGSVIEA